MDAKRPEDLEQSSKLTRCDDLPVKEQDKEEYPSSYKQPKKAEFIQ